MRAFEKSKRERDSLEELQEAAEIHRKALRRAKSLAISEDMCLQKERVISMVTKGRLEWD